MTIEVRILRRDPAGSVTLWSSSPVAAEPIVVMLGVASATTMACDRACVTAKLVPIWDVMVNRGLEIC